MMVETDINRKLKLSLKIIQIKTFIDILPLSWDKISGNAGTVTTPDS
jgi:hypothetical protein